jgi:hypothetical protein
MLTVIHHHRSDVEPLVATPVEGLHKTVTKRKIISFVFLSSLLPAKTKHFEMPNNKKSKNLNY